MKRFHESSIAIDNTAHQHRHAGILTTKSRKIHKKEAEEFLPQRKHEQQRREICFSNLFETIFLLFLFFLRQKKLPLKLLPSLSRRLLACGSIGFCVRPLVAAENLTFSFRAYHASARSFVPLGFLRSEP